MNPERQGLARQLFDDFVAMYAGRDPRLLSRLSENFSGIAGSIDKLVKGRAEGVEMTLRDFAQIPEPLHIEMLDFFAQDIATDVLAVTASFHIHLPQPNPEFARETARLVLLFRQENEDWMIAHCSISVPYGVAQDHEAYPLNRMQQKRNELEALVSERTQALADANLRLQKLSETDGLTGIANRRHFDEHLAHEWARAQRTQVPLSLIMLDVDRFKHFNDFYGHIAGDACLQALSKVLEQAGARRDEDLAARYGGEEFVVLLPGLDAQAALRVAEHIQQAILTLAMPHADMPTGMVTVSFGVASVVPQRNQESNTLVQTADEAMYRAKQAGRNRIELAS